MTDQGPCPFLYPFINVMKNKKNPAMTYSPTELPRQYHGHIRA